jgi:hypothetical protein
MSTPKTPEEKFEDQVVELTLLLEGFIRKHFKKNVETVIVDNGGSEAINTLIEEIKEFNINLKAKKITKIREISTFLDSLQTALLNLVNKEPEVPEEPEIPKHSKKVVDDDENEDSRA